MKYWLAGICASGMAWIVNSYVVRRGGDRAVILAVPVLEETIKTGVALFWGTSVPYTHSVFGLVEGVHDYVVARGWGLLAGLVSMTSHWLFGQATLLIFNTSGSWLAGVLGASLLHTCLNYLMVRLFAALSRLGRR